MEAWLGALAYTAQLYFDFSGYSDMAIGLGLLFGVLLPLNFYSPYKAKNIIDFWRRWHMTLSRFLRDYLYIPLGGNQKGSFRRYTNLAITMLLGGLWHGAGWTFVLWGALHGFYLVVNHAWHRFRLFLGINAVKSSPITRLLAWVTTFLAVVMGWVFFRAETVGGATNLIYSMFGLVNRGEVLDKVSVGPHDLLDIGGVSSWSAAAFPNDLVANPVIGVLLVIGALLLAVIARNVGEIFLKTNGGVFSWRPTIGFAFITAVVFTFCIFNITGHSEFLYFQF
jgi:hypothetical protein